eukprot:IDg6707t1
MIEQAAEHGERHIQTRTLKQFPQHFNGNEKARYAKVSLWWRKRDATMSLRAPRGRNVPFSSDGVNGVRRTNFKALPGRGEKEAFG